MLHYHVRARAFESARHQLDEVLSPINVCIDQHTGKTTRTLPWEYVELVILDEVERLNTATLEYLRDIFDRNDIGLILIDMPGIETVPISPTFRRSQTSQGLQVETSGFCADSSCKSSAFSRSTN